LASVEKELEEAEKDKKFLTRYITVIRKKEEEARRKEAEVQRKAEEEARKKAEEEV
jgi:hypothetical protein